MDFHREDFAQWVAPPPEFNEESFVLAYVVEMELGSYRFRDLFQDIRPFFDTDRNLPDIARALGFFPPLFQGLKKKRAAFLSSEKEHLLAWFCQRIANATDDATFRAGLEEVVSTITVLLSWEKIEAENAVDIITAVFALSANISYKDLKPSTRASLLTLVRDIFTRFETRLGSRPGVSNFVTGITDMAQFEKTPKCLGILFPLYTQVTLAWAGELGAYGLAEKMFKSFYRYFPVDVRRNFVQEPGVPTLEELSEALQQCISSHKIYADLTFENLLGNLDFDQATDSKKKTLAMTLRCASKYDIIIIRKWADKMWQTLKHEIWHEPDDEIIQDCLKILHQIARTLATEGGDWEHQRTSLTRFVNQICLACDMKSQESKQWYVPNGKVLCALAASSVEALWTVTKTCIPKMLLRWQALSSNNDKGHFLMGLNEIMKAHIEIYKDYPDVSNDPKMATVVSALGKLHNDIVAMYDTALQTGPDHWVDEQSTTALEIDPNNFKLEEILVKSAIHGLALSIEIPKFHEAESKGAIVTTILEVLSSTLHESTRSVCVSVLQQIAANDPFTLATTVLPRLFRDLPDQINTANSTVEECEKKVDIAIRVLETAVEICCTTVCHRELAAVGPREESSNFWHRNFDALQHKLLLKLDEVVTVGSQLDFAIILVVAVSQALTKFEESLESARASPAAIEPKPYRFDVGPYTYIVMALFKVLGPHQIQHERWQHTQELQWYTIIRDFRDSSEQKIDRLVQTIGEVTLNVLRSKLTTSDNNFLANWNDDEENECSALSSLFTTGSPGCPMECLDLWQSDVRRGPSKKCLSNVLAMYMVAGTRPKDRRNLGIDLYEAGTFMMKAYIGYDRHAFEQYREHEFPCSPLGRQSMLWYIQLVVNKFGVAYEGPEESEDTLRDIMIKYAEDIHPNATPIDLEKHARILQVLAHFAAAALASFDIQTADKCLHSMIICLEGNRPTGLMAARLFRVLLEPSDILNRANFCKMRSISRSWLLENISARLRLKWEHAVDQPWRGNYLVALAGLLSFIDPKEWIEDHGAEFLPLILQGTDIHNDSPAKLVYLKALSAFIQNDPEAVGRHLPTVFRSMGNRIHNTPDDPSDSTVKCRAAAVDVLKQLIKNVDRQLLVNFRVAGNTQIQWALADCSPDVRQKAQEVNVLWILLWEISV